MWLIQRQKKGKKRVKIEIYSKKGPPLPTTPSHVILGMRPSVEHSLAAQKARGKKLEAKGNKQARTHHLRSKHKRANKANPSGFQDVKTRTMGKLNAL